MIGRVLQRAWRELWALTFLLLLLLLLCTHLGNTVQEEQFKRIEYSSRRNVFDMSLVFVSALLPFSRGLPVSTSGRCISAIHLAWPDGSSETVQGAPSPGTSLWATTDGGDYLALGQTLWSRSHPYIQVHITCIMAVWIGC